VKGRNRQENHSENRGRNTTFIKQGGTIRPGFLKGGGPLEGREKGYSKGIDRSPIEISGGLSLRGSKTDDAEKRGGSFTRIIENRKGNSQPRVTSFNSDLNSGRLSCRGRPGQQKKRGIQNESKGGVGRNLYERGLAGLGGDR